MDGVSLKNIILGFVAGALATVTIHEVIKHFLVQAGYLPPELVPWSLELIKTGPLAPFDIPSLGNDAFWGGLWGSVFALILGNAPVGSMTLRGAILGLLGPALIGKFTLVPYIKGEPLFMGGDVTLIGSVLLILLGFGAVTAWLYGFLASGCRLP